IRLDSKATATLTRIATATGKSLSEILRELIPNDQWADVLIHETKKVAGKDVGAALYSTAAEGLRKVMSTSHMGMKPFFLDVHIPDALPGLYLEWVDGL